MAGTLFVVATPIGNLEDISARALRVLGTVALIAAEDTRRTAHLLSRYSIHTPTFSLHAHNEHRRTPLLVNRLMAGESLALVTDAGTPTVSDPGARLVAAAREAGARVEPVPGPSALMAALSVCGFPMTAFTFLGFPPTRPNDRFKWLTELRNAGRPVVFFEAPHRITRTLAEVHQTVGNVRIAVAREMTKAHEELVVGPIFDVLSRSIRPQGEFTVVIEIGQSTEYERSSAASHDDTSPSGETIPIEFGVLTNNGLLSRREAISILAKRHGLSARDVYRAIENAHL